MFEAAPKYLTLPASGEPYVYSYEELDEPASGETTGPARHAVAEAPPAGARLVAYVVAGPAGTRVEVSPTGAGGSWVDGATGFTATADVYFRAIAPGLGGAEASPVAEIVVGREVTREGATWRA